MTTDWVVVSTNAPPQTWRLLCLRCGDCNDTALPMSATELGERTLAFVERHKACLPPVEPP